MRLFQINIPFGTLAICVLLAACQAGDAADDAMTISNPESESGFEFEGSFRGPLGLQLWSVRHAMDDDLAGTLAWVHEMGFREVETAGTHGRTVREFRQILDEAGLSATAMHTGYERLRDSLEVVLDEAEVLGAEYVGTAWIPRPPNQPFDADFAREVAEEFNAWGAAASRRGIQFFYHVHGYEFQPEADGTVPFDELVAATDPDHVAYEIDVFWVALPGVDPVELLRKYPDRWALMHVKDMRVGTPRNDHSGAAPEETNVAVGEGQLDYPAVLRAAQEIGLARYYIEDETTDPMANIPTSIRFMETVQF